MADAIRILVALGDHADRQLLESAITDDFLLRIVAYAEQDDDWGEFLARPGDVVLVVCGSEDDGAAQMVERIKQHMAHRLVARARRMTRPSGEPIRRGYSAGALILSWLSGFTIGFLALLIAGVLISRIRG